MMFKMSVRPAIASLALLAAMMAGVSTPVHAEDASSAVAVRKTARHAQPGVFQYKLGSAWVTALSDGSVPQDLHELLRGATPTEIDGLLREGFRTNPVEASINAYLINLDGRLLLLDTGSGDFFGPGLGGRLLARLESIGVSPTQITDILLTHVHTDHSGGLVRQGRMVFPNAVVHVGQADLDFFLAKENQNGVGGYDKAYFAQGTESLAPYVAAGQTRGFHGETTILPGVTALPTPGHTPGHAFYRVESQGQALTFIGDLLHVQAVQLPRPDITIQYDVDQSHARTTRLQQLDRLSQGREVIAGVHIPFPGIGQVRRQGEGFQLVPVDAIDR